VAAGSAFGSPPAAPLAAALMTISDATGGVNPSAGFGVWLDWSGTNVKRKTPDSAKATTATTIARRSGETTGEVGGAAFVSG
jgi:hypothetical protein